MPRTRFEEAINIEWVEWLMGCWGRDTLRRGCNSQQASSHLLKKNVRDCLVFLSARTLLPATAV
jgi:hypothetical protein